MYQSIKLMELPLVDLREKIAEELERNPALEIVDDRSTVSLDNAEPGHKEVEEYFESSSDSGFQRGGTAGASASNDHHSFIEGVLTRRETLQQHLLWQLQLEPVDDELRSAAAILIQNLDDDGFHREPPETLFSAVPMSRLREALSLVRTLDPVGCCTADYRESLKVQIALLREDPGCMECAMDHLELFEKGKFSTAAKGMNCDRDRARECFNSIKKLSPFPGRSFSVAEVRFVVPDIHVVRDGGDFVIVFNDEVIPVLGISPFFKKLNPGGGRGDTPQENTAREFARENIREAKVFINSIAMRNHTLKMVMGALLEFQRAFFAKGPRYLVPLTLNDIAIELGVHTATVSRIANGKYVQTEWGIFELRRFFTNSISGTGSSGSPFSKEGVKAIIREMVENEKKGLSDIEISEALAQHGISLARRTVAKYRKELALGSSYDREQVLTVENDKNQHTTAGGKK